MTRKLNGVFCCDAFEQEYKRGHCCESMVDYLHDPSISIEYSAVFRAYYLRVADGVDRSITFCPACGIALPEDLGDAYRKILREEFGLDSWDEYELAPEEFKSDAWWKKRNL